MAIRKGDWKLVRYDTAADGGPVGVSPPQLYNLREDIGQTRDRSTDQPERFRQLQTTWDQWNAQLARPLWGSGKKGKGD